MKPDSRKQIPQLLASRLGNWIESGHAGPAWLQEHRLAALEQLLAGGLPGRKTEAWKYTDLTPVFDREWNFPALDAHCAATGNKHTALLHADELNIVFVNGIYRADLSNAQAEESIEITSLRSPLFATSLDQLLNRPESVIEAPFATFNRAAWRDGISITIAAKTILPKRIHLLMLHDGHTENALLVPRIHLRAGAHSEVIVAITHAALSQQACLNIPCIDVDVEDGAHCSLCQTQALNSFSFHIGTLRLQLGRDSSLHALEAAFGSAISRQNVSVAFNAPGGSAVLNGIYTINGDRLTDFHTVIDHRQPNCRSRQVYKGILDGRATAVFNGSVKVAAGACGTDGYQLNRSLLRSPAARVFTKPELLIDNDDVRCTHGATVGPLDAQQVFYLQSRGIAPAAARHILARGFVEDLLYAFPSTRQREALDVFLDHHLNEAT